MRNRHVYGYLDDDGTAVLACKGLPTPDAIAAAERLEHLADRIRTAGYPATVTQTRADLYLRLLDGTLEGLHSDQIITAMLTLGPIEPAGTAAEDPAEPEIPAPSPKKTDPWAAATTHTSHRPPDDHRAPDTTPTDETGPDSAPTDKAAPEHAATDTTEPSSTAGPGDQDARAEGSASPANTDPAASPVPLGTRHGIEVRVGLTPCSASTTTPARSPAGARPPPTKPADSWNNNTEANGVSRSPDPSATSPTATSPAAAPPTTTPSDPALPLNATAELSKSTYPPT